MLSQATTQSSASASASLRLLTGDVASTCLPYVLDDGIPHGFTITLIGKVDVVTKIFSYSVEYGAKCFVCGEKI